MSQDLASNFTSAEPEESVYTVFDDGDYPFTILEMNAITRSASGNDMLPIKLEFTSKDGDTSAVYEYLVFTPKAVFKINQFLASIKVPNGTKINFRDPEFIKYLKARSGSATLGSEQVKGKDYMRNKVVKFVHGGTSKRDEVPSHKPTPPKPPVAPPVEDDDEIPF